MPAEDPLWTPSMPHGMWKQLPSMPHTSQPRLHDQEDIVVILKNFLGPACQKLEYIWTVKLDVKLHIMGDLWAYWCPHGWLLSWSSLVLADQNQLFHVNTFLCLKWHEVTTMCRQRCFHEKPRELRRACKCWDDPAASAPRGRRWRLDGFVSMQSSPEKIGERHFTWPSNDLNLYAARPRIIQVRYISIHFTNFHRHIFHPSAGGSISAPQLPPESSRLSCSPASSEPFWWPGHHPGKLRSVQRPYDVPLHWLVCWDPYIGLW